MYSEFDKIDKAKAVLLKLAKGINPLTGDMIEGESFLNDARIVRCFYFVSEILDNVTNGVYNHGRKKPAQFVITPEQKEKVEFPQYNIGVNEFSKCINSHIDLSISKRLTGMELNKRLKKLGILSEVGLENGKTRTVVNDSSKDYGFETEKRTYNGVEYDMVAINDKGKKYLLDNIENIMSAEL